MGWRVCSASPAPPPPPSPTATAAAEGASVCPPPHLCRRPLWRPWGPTLPLLQPACCHFRPRAAPHRLLSPPPPPPSPTAAAAAEGGGCVGDDGVVLGGCVMGVKLGVQQGVCERGVRQWGRLKGSSRRVASSASSPEATISGSPASLLRQSLVGPLVLPLVVAAEPVTPVVRGRCSDSQSALLLFPVYLQHQPLPPIFFPLTDPPPPPHLPFVNASSFAY
ncbi:unnamed protein product, partial [Closterium sp. NIES-54]